HITQEAPRRVFVDPPTEGRVGEHGGRGSGQSGNRSERHPFLCENRSELLLTRGPMKRSWLYVFCCCLSLSAATAFAQTSAPRTPEAPVQSIVVPTPGMDSGFIAPAVIMPSWFDGATPTADAWIALE